MLLGTKTGDPTGDPGTWVRSVYASVLGRSPSSIELATWVGYLDAGRSPTWVARSITTSLEGRQVVVRQLTEGLLHRTPTSAELTQGARLLRTDRDWRPFTVQLVADDEYLAVASGG